MYNCEAISDEEVSELWRIWNQYHFPVLHDAIATRTGGTIEKAWNDIILLDANAINDEP